MSYCQCPGELSTEIPQNRGCVSDSKWRKWNIADGKLVATLKGHSGIVRAVLFSPDGKLLFSSGEDKTVKQWSVETQSELKTLLEDDLPIVYMAVSPDGKLLATSSGVVTPRKNGKVKLWDIKTGKGIRTIEENRLTSLAFSPDGKWLVCRNRWLVLTLFDVETGSPRRALSQTFGGASVKFSPMAARWPRRIAMEPPGSTTSPPALCWRK